MTARVACVGGGTSASADALADALVEAGFEIEPAEGGSDLDLAVLLDVGREEAAIASVAAERWLRSAVDALTDGFASVRAVVPRLVARSGVLVVVTSLAGTVGVPGRSLDSVVAAGLTGLVRSVLHEAPSISAMLIASTIPMPSSTRSSADVAWPAADVPSLADVAIVRSIARQVAWIVADADARAPGTLVTLTTTPVP